MLDHSITDCIAPYDLHKTPDLISENLNIPRVITYLF